MIVAIDFDQTYTADRDTWDKIIDILTENDHVVYCVTCRAKWDTGSKQNGIARIRKRVLDVFFTDNKPKIEYMERKGYHIDVWIDDTPATITGGGKVMWK